jgi:hypothetical protein
MPAPGLAPAGKSACIFSILHVNPRYAEAQIALTSKARKCYTLHSDVIGFTDVGVRATHMDV